MAIALEDMTAQDFDKLWQGGKDQRETWDKRARYYAGDMAIKGEPHETYADGTPKAEVVTNWIADIVDRHVGALSPNQLTLNEAEEGEEPREDEAVKAYDDLVIDQGLAAIDIENRRMAILFGEGVEVHSFPPDAKSIKIVNYDPREWVIIRDADDVIFVAVHQVTLKQGEVYEGEVLQSDLAIMTVYTDTTIRTYKGAQKSEKKVMEPGWTLIDTQTINYGQVPVVQWRINSAFQSHISEAVMDQNDEYNDIDSAHGDSVRQDADSMLKVKGIGPNWAAENVTTITKLRLLPLPKDADAEYMSRTFDTDRIDNRLLRTRKQIHMMGKTPDVGEIVGTSGATSGIALKLMFTPMQEAAQSFIEHLKESFRDRMDLINVIWNARSMPTIEDYTITIQFRIPVNRIEEWANISALDEEVSQQTRLELLTDILDPQKELERLEKERADKVALVGLDEPAIGEEADVVARRDREIIEQGDSLLAAIEPVLITMSERVAQAVTTGLKRQDVTVKPFNGGNET